jgi:hypothetical protein
MSASSRLLTCVKTNWIDYRACRSTFQVVIRCLSPRRNSARRRGRPWRPFPRRPFPNLLRMPPRRRLTRQAVRPSGRACSKRPRWRSPCSVSETRWTFRRGLGIWEAAGAEEEEEEPLRLRRWRQAEARTRCSSTPRSITRACPGRLRPIRTVLRNVSILLLDWTLTEIWFIVFVHCRQFKHGLALSLQYLNRCAPTTFLNFPGSIQNPGPFITKIFKICSKREIFVTLCQWIDLDSLCQKSPVFTPTNQWLIQDKRRLLWCYSLSACWNFIFLVWAFLFHVKFAVEFYFLLKLCSNLV